MTFSSVFLFYRGPQRECKNEFSNLVPVGLFNILYYLKKNGINAKLYNLSHFSEKKLYGFLNNLKPEISFISSFYGNHWEAIKLSELIKKNYPNSVTIIGGPISVIGEDILRKFRNIDYIIYGEGETASLKLVKFLHEKITNIKEIENLIYWENDKIKKNPPSFYNNIDEFFYIPSQIKNNVNFVQDENFQVLITSRGCPFSCSFCSSPVLWGRKVRFHSIENIIRYVKDLIENLGLNYFSIRDDNFLANKKRVVEFSKEIIKRATQKIDIKKEIIKIFKLLFTTRRVLTAAVLTIFLVFCITLGGIQYKKNQELNKEKIIIENIGLLENMELLERLDFYKEINKKGVNL